MTNNEGVTALLQQKRAERAEADLAAAKADAERYRWLRDPPGDWWNTYAVCAQDEALFGDKLDAAIDAAIAGSKEKP